jgi:hypothetical protein
MAGLVLASLAAFIGLCMESAGDSLPHWSKNINSVEVVKTAELLANLPRAAQEESFIWLQGTQPPLKVRVKNTLSHDWWDPASYSGDLQSVIVRTSKAAGAKKMCLLMADTRQTLWEDSRERHLHYKGPGEGGLSMWLLPAMINLVYAVQQNYDFVHFQLPYRYTLRHPAWLKLVAIRAMLPLYDYVMFMDSDALIRPTRTPQGVMESMVVAGQLDNPGKVMAVTREAEKYPDVANTGIIVLKQCPEALQLLADWWLSILRHKEWTVYRMFWSYEQGALTRVIYPEYNQSISLLSLSEYNSPTGKHIQHVWSLLTDNEREQIFLHAASSLLEQVEVHAHEQMDLVGKAKRLIEMIDVVLAGKRY